MSNAENAQNLKHLPQFVGYAEVAKALGVTRRTIERMVRARTFPLPIQLAPNRVGWKLETISAWLQEREKGLVAHAVAHPKDLAPEELARKAHEVAAHALSAHVGEVVDPSQIVIQAKLPMTDEEIAEHRANAIEEFESRFAHFEPERAALVVSWLFPSLRPFFEDAFAKEIRQVFEDPEALRENGHHWLHDELWEEFVEERGKLRSRQPRN